MKRRDFIRAGMLATAGLGLGGRPLRAGVDAAGRLLGQAGANDDKVVVVVNLDGGNDALNTIVPIATAEYDEYRRLRPRLAYDLPDLLSISGVPDYAFSPQMGAFRSLYDQGRLSIIAGVGVPETASGKFDHEASQYTYQTCDIARGSGTGAPTGWLGRYLDGVPAGPVTAGVNVGRGRLMLTGNSTVPIRVRNVDRFNLSVRGPDRTDRRSAYETIMAIPSTVAPAAEQNRRYREQALAESQIIRDGAADYLESVTYPDTSFGRRMRECAKLIYADVGIRGIAVYRGGFDTHADQNRRRNGNMGDHDAMLQDVTQAVSAFYDDLINQGLSHRVLIVTMTEFGRRAKENGDRGTDHGLSSVAFALGDMVNGGFYGSYPSVLDLVLRGNLRPTTDFRSVYASVAANFLGEDPVPIVGGSFPLIPFV